MNEQATHNCNAHGEEIVIPVIPAIFHPDLYADSHRQQSVVKDLNELK